MRSQSSLVLCAVVALMASCSVSADSSAAAKLVDPNQETEAADYTCGCASCTRMVLNQMAKDDSGDYTCGNRINWLITAKGMHETDACQQVANTEFPTVCGPACDPLRCNENNDNEEEDVSSSPSAAPVEEVVPVPSPSPCGCDSCTVDALQRMATDAAGTYPCQSRMMYLVQTGKVANEHDACVQVANVEFPEACGWECDPLRCNNNNNNNDPLPETPAPVTSAPVASPPSDAPVTAPPAAETPVPPPSTSFCGCDNCTQDILNTNAYDYNGNYTCGARMEWFRNELGLSEHDACIEVGAVQFASVCGACNPIQCNPGKHKKSCAALNCNEASGESNFVF